MKRIRNTDSSYAPPETMIINGEKYYNTSRVSELIDKRQVNISNTRINVIDKGMHSNIESIVKTYKKVGVTVWYLAEAVEEWLHTMNHELYEVLNILDYLEPRERREVADEVEVSHYAIHKYKMCLMRPKYRTIKALHKVLKEKGYDKYCEAV